MQRDEEGKSSGVVMWIVLVVDLGGYGCDVDRGDMAGKKVDDVVVGMGFLEGEITIARELFDSRSVSGDGIE